MSSSANRAARPLSPPTEAEVLAALSRLARKGAYAKPLPAAPGAPPAGYAVFSPRNGFARAIAALAGEVVAPALQAGWLEPDTGDGCLRLTPAGSKILQRVRSGAAPSRTATRAAPATRPRKPAAAPPVRAAQEAPIAWLSRRRDADGTPMISAAQRSAGERLAADFWHAHLAPRVTADWSGTATSQRQCRAAPDAVATLSDRVMAARTRVNRALAAVGPELADILLDVCCHEVGLEAAGKAHGWPARSAKVVLQLALTRLARHYGLIASDPASGAGRVRHWGGDDYKPTLDAWSAT